MTTPTITAIIIDDEVKGRETLRNLLEEFCEGVTILDTFPSIKTGVVWVKKLVPDVVFLDISLPVEDGFQFFNYFEQPIFEVVFVTAYTSYLEKASRYAALDYLMKPVYIEDLKRIVEEIRIRKAEKNQEKLVRQSGGSNSSAQLVLPTENELIFLKTDELILVREESAQVLLQTTIRSGLIQVNRSLQQFHELVRETDLILVSEECMVNPHQVIKILQQPHPALVMSNEEMVMIDPKFEQQVLQSLPSD